MKYFVPSSESGCLLASQCINDQFHVWGSDQDRQLAGISKVLFHFERIRDKSAKWLLPQRFYKQAFVRDMEKFLSLPRGVISFLWKIREPIPTFSIDLFPFGTQYELDPTGLLALRAILSVTDLTGPIKLE